VLAAAATTTTVFTVYVCSVGRTGDVYKGEFRGNQMSGAGTYKHADGERYTGEWRAGMKHGTGTYLFASA
jgi:hypothetical protein